MKLGKNLQPRNASQDLSIGPSSLMNAIQKQNPEMNMYQAAEATNLVMQEMAEYLIENPNAKLGVLIPGKPHKFHAIEPILINTNNDNK